MSVIAYAQGDYATALRYLEQSLKIQQEIGDRQGEGTTLNNISQIHKVKGDYATALRYLEQSLKIQQEIGDRMGTASTLHNMGAMLFDQQQLEAALPKLYQAYVVFDQIGSPNAEGTMQYLEVIVGQLGEDKVKDLLSQME
ncbi:MAG: tetratricopeptide repeat protein [Saprospiraceae bacterium]|nr:tetratricopeptide repeat protein [Saprospiraceae bacterium]